MQCVGFKPDKVEIAVERCLEIAREAVVRESELQVPKLNGRIVQTMLEKAMVASNKPIVEKNLCQSLMRTIADILNLAETKLASREKISSLLDIAFDSLMLGYGNLKSSNIEGRLQQLLANIYLSKEKHIVFELFSLLAGMDRIYGPVVCVDEFILTLRLYKGLNCCANPGMSVESAFTNP